MKPQTPRIVSKNRYLWFRIGERAMLLFFFRGSSPQEYQRNPQHASRIVSKSQYMGYQVRKAMLRGSAECLRLLGIVGFIALGACWQHYEGTNGSLLIGSLAFLLMCGLPVFVERVSKHQIDRADQLDPVIPLTRQTVAQLPAEQSLVRASSEPFEAQQAVLLRAARANAQTSPQELLRAMTMEQRHEA